MTGNVDHNLGEFSVSVQENTTERGDKFKSSSKSQNIKKRNHLNNSTFERH
jgi:hypothetical protein